MLAASGTGDLAGGARRRVDSRQPPPVQAGTQIANRYPDAPRPWRRQGMNRDLARNHPRKLSIKNRDTQFRNPKRVRLTITCIYLDNYFERDDLGVIAKARVLLEEHNLQLGVWPDNGWKNAFNTLAYDPDPVPIDDQAYKALRVAIDQKIRQGGCTFVIPLPIVFCQFKHPGHGIVPPAMKKFTPACLISPTPNKDRAASLWGSNCPSPGSLFSAWG